MRLSYLVKRVLLLIPMVIGISFITFIIIKLSPGDPMIAKFGLNPEVSEEDIAKIRTLYYLDKPVLEQYLQWLKRILTFDFGNSFINNKPVIRSILEALPATLILNVAALFIIFLISIPLGVKQAVYHGSYFDKISTFIVFCLYAIPTFWVALLMIYFFGFKLNLFPLSGMSPWYTEYYGFFEKMGDFIWHLTLPVIATSLAGIAGISQYMKLSMLEVLNADYILLAKAKGLSENRVFFKHALSNAILPIITIIGLSLPAMISGSVIFESIFAWPGMGRLGYLAIMSFDIPMIMGVGVFSTLLTLLGTLLSDILYVLADPRIKNA